MDLDQLLLLSPELSDRHYSSSINGTDIRGLYNPMEFVLRVRSDVQEVLQSATPGLHSPGTSSDSQILAFSTFFHETIHWWQHAGSNFGLISSLKYPAQTHITRDFLKDLLTEKRPFKAIAKYDKLHPGNTNVNAILNYWYDIEFAGLISYDPRLIRQIVRSPYFESWGHSYHIMWSASISTLAATCDPQLSFLSDIRKWDAGFKDCETKKVHGFYPGSPIAIPPIGTRAIYEGQARICQLQYLYGAFDGRLTMSDFITARLLSGVYGEALNLFLSILQEPMPGYITHPLIGLFLLLCDIAINPTDGFPFDIFHYETFVITSDPAYRFVLMCQMIRDDHPYLKTAILHFSKEEYISASDVLCRSIGSFSPIESAAYIVKWTTEQPEMIKLLEEERAYRYSPENQPIRLFFSKFLRFQQDKLNDPQVFCWPGMHLVGYHGDEKLSQAADLFEKHKAPFIDDANGNIYHSSIRNCTDEQVGEVLNTFFSWNNTYDMVRQWIIEDGPFTFNYEPMTPKFPKEEIARWASDNLEQAYGVRPEDFRILAS